MNQRWDCDRFCRNAGFGGRGLESPYSLHFCGKRSFRHRLTFDRSSLSRWRRRFGEEQLATLIPESLTVADRTGALATKDLESGKHGQF